MSNPFGTASSAHEAQRKIVCYVGDFGVHHSRPLYLNLIKAAMLKNL